MHENELVNSGLLLWWIGGAVVVAVTVALWFLWPDDSRAAEWWRVLLLDQPYEDVQDGEALGRGGQPRIIALSIAHARTELGLLTDTPSNRMVVSDVVRKFMKNHGMRPTHISTHFPMAVEFYFLRSTQDDQLLRMRQSRGYNKYRRVGGGA